jgi:hypothetical protein
MILLILSLVPLYGQYFSDSGELATKSVDQVGVMYEMHRVLTPLHPFLQAPERQVEINWDMRAILPKHINYMSSSALSPSDFPYKRNAELSQRALYFNHYSEIKCL